MGDRLRVLSAMLPLVLSPCLAGAVDLTGNWRFETTGSSVVQITQVTQTGTAVSFSLYGWAFSGSVTPVGAFTNYSVSATSPTPARIDGRIMPSGDLLDGRAGIVMPPDPPAFGGLLATRCTCDDGNTTGGDGLRRGLPGRAVLDVHRRPVDLLPRR